MQGASIAVTLTPENMSFPAGSTANFGPDISVGGAPPGTNGPVVPQPNGTAIANLVIAANATLGPRNVQANGTASVVRAGAFTVTPAVRSLTLTAISPASGPALIPVDVNATGFEIGTAIPSLTVTLTPQGGGAPIAVSGAVSGLGLARTINFTLPGEAAPGVYSVSLSGSGYLSTNSLPFTVTPASFSLTPTSGTVGSTVQVTLVPVNTSFPSGTTASFAAGISVGGGPEGQPGPVAIQPNGTAIATLVINPNAAVGPRTVQVNGAVVLQQANAFTVLPAPSITSVNPSNGQQGTSVPVTITAVNAAFNGSSIVSFGPDITINATSVTGPNTINANLTIAPNAALGARDVVVTSNGIPLAGSGLFTVVPAGQIISVTPNSGQQGRSFIVNIVGQNTQFTAGSVVSFGSEIVVNSVTSSGPTGLTVTITLASDATPGPRDVSVTTGGVTVSKVGAFNVTTAPPQITTVAPSSGQRRQRLLVNISGVNTNFNNTSVASFNAGVAVNSTTVNSASSVTADITVDANAVLGPRDVVVTTDGIPVVGAGLFTITEAPPEQIISITPGSARQGETFGVEIIGSGTTFNSNSVVSLGSGAHINSVTRNSDTSITANITVAEGATVGLRDVSVTTNGTPVIGAGLFRVTAAPGEIISVSPSSGLPSQTQSVIVTARNTNFTSDSVVSFGSDVQTNSVVRSSATSLTANITVGPKAVPGKRAVSVTTGSEVVALADAFTVLANGSDQPLTCAVNAGVPPLLRAEGFTELTGDLLIVCTGGTQGQSSRVNLQLFLNVPITSRAVGQGTEALLLVDESTTPGNVHRAIPAQRENAIVWPDLEFIAPGPGTQRVLRITNVRANVTSLAASASLVPSQVSAFLSVSPSQALPLAQAQHTVGFVQRGLTFDVTACNGAAASLVSFAQCEDENAAGGGNMQLAVRFTEGFQSAFKPQFASNQIPSTPGMVYNSESGFIAGVGAADFGTRLVARFNNIPNGVRLFVTSRPSIGSTPGLDAVLVQPAGNSSATLFCAAAPNTGVAGTELTIQNGSATVWEITSANPAALESAVFGVAVAYDMERRNADRATQSPGLVWRPYPATLLPSIPHPPMPGV